MGYYMQNIGYHDLEMEPVQMESNTLHFSGWDKTTPKVVLDQLSQKLKQFGPTKNVFQSFEQFFIDVHFMSADVAQQAKEYYEKNPIFRADQYTINLKVQIIDSKNQEKQRTQEAQLQKFFEEMKDEAKAEFMISLRDMAMQYPADCKYLLESYPVLGWVVNQITIRQ